MTTFGDAVTRARYRHGSIDPTLGLEWAIEVYDELLLRTEISRKSFDLTLVAGTADYALPATVKFIHHADYLTDTDQGFSLDAISLEEVELYYPGYRITNPEGTPTFYVFNPQETGSTIKFVPAPDTASSGGIPKIVLQCSTRPAITSSSNLPDVLINKDLFVDGILAKHARLFKDSDFEALEMRYRDAMDRAVVSFKTVSREEDTIYMPMSITQIPRVR